MGTVLDWTAYVISGAVAAAVLIRLLWIVASGLIAVRKGGLRVVADAWFDQWRYWLFLAVLIGTVMFVQWRLDQ